ncbi:MAG: hypothetical protein GT597_13810 [Bacteroidales bacterium]|jgi:hypothetical protein|nr:hypothetical protein [Bacteroidales bacterium]
MDKDLQQIIDATVAATLSRLGIPTIRDGLWISQAEATRMTSRRKLERAMREGRVRFEKIDMSSKQGRVLVNLMDIKKLLQQPTHE